MTKFESVFSPTPSVPFTHIGDLLSIMEVLRSMGVPVEKYAEKSGIPLGYLEQPEASIPLILAGRFAEIVSSKEGLEDFGATFGYRFNALEDYGTYSRMLNKAPTCLSYLEQGSRAIGQLTTGVNIWLSKSTAGNVLNIDHPGLEEGWGVQPALFILGATLRTLYEISGCRWSPVEIRLPSQVRLGDRRDRAFRTIPIVEWDGPISFLIDDDLLALPLNPTTEAVADAAFSDTLPLNLTACIERTIWMLLEDGRCSLETVAETVGLHPRSLQRQLHREGLILGDLVKAQRHRMAVSLLEDNDMSITDIAFQLGYSDASNFARAFRKLAGCSPSFYRFSR